MEKSAASAASVTGRVFQAVMKSAASAASPDYVKFQAVIKSAASAASPRGGRASGRLGHGHVFAFFGRATGKFLIKLLAGAGECHK